MTIEWDVARDSRNLEYGMMSAIDTYSCYNYFTDATGYVGTDTTTLVPGEYIKYASAMGAVAGVTTPTVDSYYIMINDNTFANFGTVAPVITINSSI